MASQIEIQGNIIELKDVIKYTFQCNDIAQVSDRQASYTNSFKVPKTSDVVAIFEGLGIAGDTSTSPYRKVSCRLFDNYVPVLEKGWLQIRHTDDRYYHIAVYSGVIDFFKAIENRTTDDIDFSDLAHDKDVPTIVSSWENDLPYRYFIADFGAGEKRVYNPGGGDAIDAGVLQPAFKISWLWDKIFQTFGFTYSGSIFQGNDFNNRYITYPKPRLQTVEEHAAHLRKVNAGPFGTYSGPLNQDAWRPFLAGGTDNRYEFYPVEGSNPIGGTPDGWQIIINEPGYYRFEIHVNAEMFRPAAKPEQRPFRFEATGTPSFIYDIIQPNQDWDRSYTVQMSAGSVVDFLFDKDFQDEPWAAALTFNDFTVNVYKITSSEPPTEALLKINLTDFFKEVLWMFGLTAIPDKYSNNIKFLTLQDRIDAAPTVDWSDMYVRRTKEEYVYGYAKENYLRHQYTDEGDDSYDGVIRVNDENLKESSTLITSHFFAPNRFNLVPFVSGIQAKVYPFMTVRDDGTDEFDNGKHFLISGRLQDVTARMGLSGLPGSAQDVGPVFVEDFDSISYERAVSRYYEPLEDVLNDTRIHTIELCISPADVAELRFDVLYYFDQEANYYLLNRLQFETGKFATGEFVRVKLTRTFGEYSDDYSDDYNI